MGLAGLVVVVAVLAGMAVVAVVAVGGTTSVPSVTTAAGATGGSAAAGIGGLVSGAGDEVAQQNLSSALAAADQVALGGGGYGAVDATALAASTRGLRYVAGTSTAADTVSVAPVAAAGAVAMAVRSTSGTCWSAWRSAATTWYGRGRPGGPCAAVATATPPAAGSGSGGTVWQQGSFP
jgi:hypothetical protein